MPDTSNFENCDENYFIQTKILDWAHNPVLYVDAVDEEQQLKELYLKLNSMVPLHPGIPKKREISTASTLNDEEAVEIIERTVSHICNLRRALCADEELRSNDDYLKSCPTLLFPPNDSCNVGKTSQPCYPHHMLEHSTLPCSCDQHIINGVYKHHTHAIANSKAQ